MSINVTVVNGQPRAIDIDVTDLNVGRVVTRGLMHPQAYKVIAIRQDSGGYGAIKVTYSDGRVETHRYLRANSIVTL